MGPDRVYKYYIRPFYRAYVEDEAEKLIQEIDRIQERVKPAIEHVKEKVSKEEVTNSKDKQSHDKTKDRSAQIRRDDTAAAAQSDVQDDTTVPAYVNDIPPTDDIDNRMLQSTRQQVESLDSQLLYRTDSRGRAQNHESVSGSEVITLQPSTAIETDDNMTSSSDTTRPASSTGRAGGDNSNNDIMTDDDLLTLSPTNVKGQDGDKKCKVQ